LPEGCVACSAMSISRAECSGKAELAICKQGWSRREGFFNTGVAEVVSKFVERRFRAVSSASCRRIDQCPKTPSIGNERTLRPIDRRNERDMAVPNRSQQIAYEVTKASSLTSSRTCFRICATCLCQSAP